MIDDLIIKSALYKAQEEVRRKHGISIDLDIIRGIVDFQLKAVAHYMEYERSINLPSLGTFSINKYRRKYIVGIPEGELASNPDTPLSDKEGMERRKIMMDEFKKDFNRKKKEDKNKTENGTENGIEIIQ